MRQQYAVEEIENLEKQHLTRQMHKQVRGVTHRRRSTHTIGIMDKHYNTIMVGFFKRSTHKHMDCVHVRPIW